MDILIVYWNSVWRQSLKSSGHSDKGPTFEEWAAFRRRTKGR